jgi:opacity protein-like surface antigen
MTRILTSIAVAFFVMCGVATAADIPVKAPVPPPPPAVGCCDWTGVYIGVHSGGGWGKTDITLDTGKTLFADSVDKRGWLAGVQLGANVQLMNYWVLGAEFSLSKTGIDGSNGACFPAAALANPTTCFAEDQWLLLGMGRLGFAFTPSILGYITGGVAVAGITTNLQQAGFTPNFARSSVVHDGWAYGIGWEYQWQWSVCCRHFVVGAELLRVNLDEKTHENVVTRQVSQDFYIARARLSLKFGQGAPSQGPGGPWLR